MDLNLPWPTWAGSVEEAHKQLLPTIALMNDFGYSTIALSVTIQGKLPSVMDCPIPRNPFPEYPKIRFLSRLTVILDESNQNYNLANFSTGFDIVAVRPTNQKLFQQACTSLDIALISLDPSRHLGYFLRHKPVGAAIDRGIRFEICYGAASGYTPGNLVNTPSTTTTINRTVPSHKDILQARRQIHTFAISLVRASRNRGLVISSEVSTALQPVSLRPPWDIVNMAVAVWGFKRQTALQAVGLEPISLTKSQKGGAATVIRAGRLRNASYKQVVEVVDDSGEEDEEQQESVNKRTANDEHDDSSFRLKKTKIK